MLCSAAWSMKVRDKSTGAQLKPVHWGDEMPPSGCWWISTSFQKEWTEQDTHRDFSWDGAQRRFSQAEEHPEHALLLSSIRLQNQPVKYIFNDTYSGCIHNILLYLTAALILCVLGWLINTMLKIWNKVKWILILVSMFPFLLQDQPTRWYQSWQLHRQYSDGPDKKVTFGHKIPPDMPLGSTCFLGCYRCAETHAPDLPFKKKKGYPRT